jgi:hypothetical protein
MRRMRWVVLIVGAALLLLLDAAVLPALCAFFIMPRWGKLNSLWGDPARWLFEVYRAAQGETLYRNFAWQFPPLSLLLMSGALRLLDYIRAYYQPVFEENGGFVLGLQP